MPQEKGEIRSPKAQKNRITLEKPARRAPWEPTRQESYHLNRSGSEAMQRKFAPRVIDENAQTKDEI